jgi:RNA methyltransferase, TrmH family
MGLISMSNTYINSLVERYKIKIKHVGMQSDEINQIKRIINGNCPDDEKLFAVEGIWAHQKLLSTNIEIKTFIFCPECIYSNEASLLVETFLKKTEEVFVVSKKVFGKLSERDEPDGLISLGKFPVYDIENCKLKTDPVIIVLDGLETPGNIGTILRTCDGAGVDAVLICNKRARITNTKLIKGSMGAAFVIPIVKFDCVNDCIMWLMARNFNIYLADTKADKTYKSYEYGGNTALVVGSERYGISEEWYNLNSNMLSIPMLGVCDSLNVGTAASIITYEICTKKNMKGCGKMIL